MGLIAACGGGDPQGELVQRDTIGVPPLTDTSRDEIADSAPDSGEDTAPDTVDTVDTTPGPDTTGLGEGEPCQEDTQCLSGHCVLIAQGGGGRCAALCDPTAPLPETCNGKDDDCDGEVDGTDLCGDYACAGAAGCKTRCEANADCRPGLGCDRADRDGDGVTDECVPNGDDGTLCSADEDCGSDLCSNGYCCPVGVGQARCCAQDGDCAELDRPGSCVSADATGCVGRKTVGRCEGFVCVSRQAAAPELCAGTTCQAGVCTGDTAGGPVFGGPHLCDAEGACLPTPDRRCDDNNACTVDTCGVAGCEAAPFSGTTGTACYTFAAATRGVGLCADGAVKCEGGAVSGCVGERGPGAEVCNGKDDDCDGLTDEDTEPSCFPYLCAGTAGCGVSCSGNQDCAAGNFCQAGRCVGTGQSGASCASNEQCASGHCSQGVCCASGLCCVSASQCGGLGQTVCESPSGCSGFTLTGVCTGENRCEAVANVDAGACAGRTCAEGRCDGASVVAPSLCSATGQCVGAVPVSCAPYACKDGACKTSCVGDTDCSVGSCVAGRCAGLPNGSACTTNGQCAAGRCNNGFCCASGTCCGDDQACSGLTQAPTCSSADTCGGTQVVGVCGAAFACRAETRAAPAACLGSSCGSPRCVNLSGGGVVLEGVERKTCNATGACVTAVKDCRDFDDTAYCTNNSTVYATCGNCSPRRSTCVVFDNPCFCE